ncbi:MAG: cell division protein FtsQ/DivIB [Chloroflexota bacterium]
MTRTGKEPSGPPRALLPGIVLLLSLAVLAAIVGGLFKVREVQVIGANLPRAQVASAAAVSGRNIFSVQSDQVVRRLGRLHSVQVVRVDTSFPGQVTIVARMRRPVAGWQEGKSLYLVGADGTITQRVRATTLPIVIAQGGARPDPAMLQAVRYATRRLSTVPNSGLCTYSFAPRQGLTIASRKGWKASVGRGSTRALFERIATLVALLRQDVGQSRNLVSVDLRTSPPYARFSP